MLVVGGQGDPFKQLADAQPRWRAESARPKVTRGAAIIRPSLWRGFSDASGFWKMYCTSLSTSERRWRAGHGIGCPSKESSPVTVPACSPLRLRASVVLPLPDSPTSARQVPLRTLRSTSCRTRVLP